MIKKIIVFAVFFGLLSGVALAHEGHSGHLLAAENEVGIKEEGVKFTTVGHKTVEELKKVKDDYLKTRKEFQEIKANARSAEGKAKSIEKGKEMVKKMIDRMIEDLEKIKERVKNIKDLEDADESSIIAKIDAEIAALSALKAKVDAAQTKEELRGVLKEVKNHWHKARRFAKHFVGRLLVHRIKKAVEKTEALLAKAEAKIAELKTAGKDTVKPEGMVTDAKNNLALAKEKYQQAKDKYLAIESLDDFQKIAKEANGLAREANKYLIEAHKILRKLIPEINKIIKPAEIGTPTGTETGTPTGTGTENIQ